MPGLHGGLHLFAHISKLRAGEHVSAFGHPRDVGRIDIGGWFVHPLERFKRVGTVGKVARCKKILCFG